MSFCEDFAVTILDSGEMRIRMRLLTYSIRVPVYISCAQLRPPLVEPLSPLFFEWRGSFMT